MHIRYLKVFSGIFIAVTQTMYSRGIIGNFFSEMTYDFSIDIEAFTKFSNLQVEIIYQIIFYFPPTEYTVAQKLRSM